MSKASSARPIALTQSVCLYRNESICLSESGAGEMISKNQYKEVQTGTFEDFFRNMPLRLVCISRGLP